MSVIRSSAHDDGISELIVPLSIRYYALAFTVGAVGCVFFAIAGLNLELQWSLGMGLWAVGIAALICLWFYVSWRYLSNPTTFGLMIDDSGVHERYITGRRSIFWSDIESIELQRIDGPEQVVVFVLKRPTSMRLWSFGRFDRHLANQYVLPQRELLSLLQKRYCRWQHADPVDRRAAHRDRPGISPSRQNRPDL